VTNNRGRKHAPQTGQLRQVRPLSADLELQADQVYCPVCGYPAWADLDDPGRYRHEYRLLPCRSPEAVFPLTTIMARYGRIPWNA
jgi:hypothetical protein